MSVDLHGLPDYHMHTALCGHATGSMHEYIERAISLGLGEIGFSEHIYLYHLPPDRRDPELAPAEHDMETYLRMVEDARESYPGFPISLGLEADYIEGHEAELERILQMADWDYVYGSVHFVGDWGMDDPRYKSRYDECQIDDLYTRYFGMVTDVAATGLFDIMAHLDLVKKFGHRPTSDLTALYGDVAQKLATSGVCIEISSGRLRKPIGEIYPHPGILKACREAGVPATLGSASHEPESVGYAFPVLVVALREAGYSE